jgi:16S rRNA (guanine1516-N2)-methyltransferase
VSSFKSENVDSGIALAVVASHGAADQRAAALAKSLGLPRASQETDAFDLLLHVSPVRLELRDQRKGGAGPVYADFVSGRRRYGPPDPADRRQPLARAVDVNPGATTVVDATAGLGRDAFFLALLGCRVTALERSAVIAALLEDGLRRARQVPLYEDAITEKLSVVVDDARRFLAGLNQPDRPDVVYLDPMYPIDPKASAAVKKEMRMLRRLVGDDPDAGELLEAALATARRRVVVKRMRHAPALGSEPSLSQKGGIVRYDVYLTRNP